MAKNRTAIITGASSGIGWQLSLLMASKGYDLGLMARRADLLERLKSELVRLHPNQKFFVSACDVRRVEECRREVKHLAAELESLDVFVANAGVGFQTPGWKENWEDVKMILETNVMGAVACLDAAKEVMLRQRSGHLVGISSVAAARGLPASAAYCSSKAALTTYLESLRIDLKPVGIAVTSIHPGYVLTAMTEKNTNMPFLLSAEKGTDLIFKAIQRKTPYAILPWQLYPLMHLVKWMPRVIYDRLIGRYSHKGVFR